MPRLYEALTSAQQLALATRIVSPAGLAQTFASFVGQFYDREDFDNLARQASGLYDAEGAQSFRAHLDRRLYDRYHTPVAWDTVSAETQRAE